MGPAGFLAVTAGWITTEAGRQPFTVYGLLRTADSVGPAAAPAVAASLLAFIVVYVVVFGAGMAFTVHLLGQTPGAHDPGPPDDQPIRTGGITAAPAITGAPENRT
jgi:cytochrome d ubiquinol oxidase subunit I